MSVQTTFSVTDTAGDTLTVTDPHRRDSLVIVEIDSATVQLTHADLDALADVLRDIYYRRQREIEKPQE